MRSSKAQILWCVQQNRNKTLLRYLQAQRTDASGRSPLQLYRDLARLRRQRTFQTGAFDFAVVNRNIFSFIRYAHDQPDYLVAINVGKEPSTDNYRCVPLFYPLSHMQAI